MVRPTSVQSEIKIGRRGRDNAGWTLNVEQRWRDDIRAVTCPESSSDFVFHPMYVLAGVLWGLSLKKKHDICGHYRASLTYSARSSTMEVTKADVDRSKILLLITHSDERHHWWKNPSSRKLQPQFRSFFELELLPSPVRHPDQTLPCDYTTVNLLSSSLQRGTRVLDCFFFFPPHCSVILK